jgi:hypothetical protein
LRDGLLLEVTASWFAPSALLAPAGASSIPMWVALLRTFTAQRPAVASGDGGKAAGGEKGKGEGALSRDPFGAAVQRWARLNAAGNC